MNERTPRVLLVQMPWATTHRPSIALGILSRLCQEENVPVRTFYPNMDITATVGFEAARRFADERSLYGLSEHLFAVALFGPDSLESDEYLTAFAATLESDEKARKWSVPFWDPAYLRTLRDEVVPRFLDSLVKRVLEESPTVVGFTATFNQVMGSLALAGQIKQTRPEVQIIAGGACFDDVMGQEYHRALPHILDHVFMGEAEESFREYLRRLKAGASTRGIPGVTSVVNGEVELKPGRPLQDLNQSPRPDYDDFFMEAARVRKETGKIFNVERVPFESSRGCWWGQKNHCVFCGINEDLMRFRAKDVDRVLKDMVALAARYRVTKLTATDWILPLEWCDELFRRLKELDLDLEIFYEVRASLKKHQIKAMKEAGIVTVQPGIESLSTPLLKLMNKHSSAIRHIQFLRWCKEAGVSASYNILAGFPGEQAGWYLEMAKLIPRIRHLQPPRHNINPIEMHRFAPLYERRDQFGIDGHAMRLDYYFNFPDGMIDPMRTGYFFRFHSTATVAEEEYMEAVREAIEPWISAHQNQKNPPVYEYTLAPDFMRIIDMRDGKGRYFTLADLHHDVTLLCDEVQSRASLARDLAGRYPNEVADGTLDGVIDQLVQADILMSEGNLLLTLPIGHKLRTTEELRAYVLGESAVSQGQPALAGATD